MQLNFATLAEHFQRPSGQIVLTDQLIIAAAQLERYQAALKRMQELSGEELERTRAERARRIRADHLNDALSLRNEDLTGQVDDLLLACEAIINATDDGLPLDDAIRQVRKAWDLYGPSDTAMGEELDKPKAEPAALPSSSDSDTPWPKRSADDAAAIALIRTEFGATGFNGTGSYCMWLEEELLAKRREADALVTAVEVCGPHIACEVLAKAGELMAPKAASNG